MTTPQFTPDGRLLQVEYASAASDLSSPLVALQLNNNTLVLIALKKSNTQNRIAVLQDKKVCVAMSGVLADSVALLQFVLKESSKHFLRCKKELSLLQIATTIANACQLHSFGGGIRPYGCSMLVCGFVGEQNTIYQTDPSGAIIEATPSSDSMNQLRWLVGGSQSLRLLLRKRIDQELDRQRNNEKASISDMIATVSRILMKETKKQAKGDKSASSSDETQTAFEVVILSPSLGCHRLTEDQLTAIMDKT